MLAAGGAVVVLSACRLPTGSETDAAAEQTTDAASGVAGATATITPAATGTAAPAATTAPTATTTPAPWTPPLEVRITPIEDFYEMKYHPSPPPEVDLAGYRLEIAGGVDNPLSLTMEEIRALPAVSEMRTLECISNPVGGNLISNANWVGVQMKEILALAGLQGSAKYLKLESLDGYHTGIPTALALDDHALLVYEMNGETLPPKHGFPLRALWPGRYGQKQPKWINRITAQTTPHTGHFEKAGWSDNAFILPNTRIEQPPPREFQPGEFYVAGIAMTNETGVEKVRVSLDNGNNWQEAELLRGPSNLTWTHWWVAVSGLENGAYRVVSNVTDGEGHSQTSPERNSSLVEGTFPDGTDEMHRVVVQVKIP